MQPDDLLEQYLCTMDPKACCFKDVSTTQQLQDGVNNVVSCLNVACMAPKVSPMRCRVDLVLSTRDLPVDR
jgi:hypothetical protein